MTVFIVYPDEHDDKQYDGKQNLAENGPFSSVIAGCRHGVNRYVLKPATKIMDYRD